MILTNASPPGNGPIRALAKLMSRTAIPPRFITCPAKIKNGMASSVKLSSEAAILCASVVTEGRKGNTHTRVSKAANPMAYATGTRMERNNKKLITRIRASRYSIPSRFYF